MRSMPSSPGPGPGPGPAPEAPSLPTDEQSNLGWNPFIFIPVAVVCMVITFVSAYRIIKQILLAINGRALTRNRIQVRRLTDGNFEDSPMQFQSPGLNSFIMHSLPVSQFTKTIEEKGSTYHECAVCLGEFEEGEWLKHLPNCTHVFHIACIDTWFQAHSSCPLCRSLVYDLSPCAGFSPDMDTFLQTLSREEYYQERAAYLQILRADILQQVAARREERYSGLVSPTQLSVENSE